MPWTPQINYLKETAKATADAAHEDALLQQKYDTITNLIKDAAKKGQYSIKIHNTDLLITGGIIYNQLLAGGFSINDPAGTHTYIISWGD